VPADCQWEPAGAPGPRAQRAAPRPVAAARVERAALALRSDEPAVLMLGGAALRERGLVAAERVRAATGCHVLHDTFVARLERGAALPGFERLPYFPEQAIQRLTGARRLVLAGTRDPVSFFGYPDVPSRLAPADCERIELASVEEDVAGALEALADALGAKSTPARVEARERPAPPASGALDVAALGRALAALQPEGAIVVDEAATSGAVWFAQAAAAPRHTLLALTGGAIGQGLPCAVGAALACPDRKVIALQADGSGMYTLQALWTMARESLDVLVVVCANRSYRILQIELARAGVAEPGPQARRLVELAHPELDWTALARGMGVPAVRVAEAGPFAVELARALAEPGPALIEALL
jgi:acetolactate synthase-1/2/3 large subunit